MKATCPHLPQIRDVGPGAAVCTACVEIGARWVHLRLCLVCGRTACCDTSPNKHASAHFVETAHPLMRSLEPDEDWIWCFLCRQTMRPDGRGGWSLVDPFFDAGLWYAREAIGDGVPLPFGPDLTTPDGYPLGLWASTYGGRRSAGSLDQEQEEAIEALPGWRW